jgi:hypothetical protein
MNWTMLGAIGELVGGVAVLVTLIYLSFQVRAVHRQNRSSAFLQIIDSGQLLALEVARNPELANLLDRVRNEETAIGNEDLIRVESIVGYQMHGFVRSYLLMKEGIVSKEEWTKGEDGIRQLGRRAITRRFMLGFLQTRGLDFRDEMERILGEN